MSGVTVLGKSTTPADGATLTTGNALIGSAGPSGPASSVVGMPVGKLSTDPELDAWAKKIMAGVLQGTKPATPCRFCKAANLEWCRDDTGHWLLRDRTSKALHSCPAMRHPTRAFKAKDWRRGRMKRR